MRGAREDVTDHAVRSALISCLRGGASSFLEYVGLEAPLDTMISKLTERYTKTAPADTLVCKFHQLQQEKSESIRQFAGRIEKLFKRLQLQIPDRYPDKSMMKDRLFYGMQGDLKSSLRYLFDKPDTTYASLLTAAHAAEVDSQKSRQLTAHVKGLTESATKLEPSSDPVLGSVEDKLDQLTTILKAAQVKKNKRPYTPSKKIQTKDGKTESLTEVSKSSPRKKGFEGRCWNCGGWGHPMRECPSQGNGAWGEASGKPDPPEPKSQDPAQ